VILFSSLHGSVETNMESCKRSWKYPGSSLPTIGWRSFGNPAQQIIIWNYYVS
jgi:hypothetical protein